MPRTRIAKGCSAGSVEKDFWYRRLVRACTVRNHEPFRSLVNRLLPKPRAAYPVCLSTSTPKPLLSLARLLVQTLPLHLSAACHDHGARSVTAALVRRTANRIVRSDEE